MHSSILRQLWSIVEKSPAERLVSLSDSDLMSQLLQRLDCQHLLTPEDKNSVKHYLSHRMLLIRDIIQSQIE